MPSATLVTGGKIAERIDAETRALLREAARRGSPAARVVAVAAMADRSVTAYLESLERKSSGLGIAFETRIETGATTARLIEAIAGLGADPSVTGILLELPLPDGVDARAVQAAIDPRKDVEGVTPASLGWLALGKPRLAPATAVAVLEVLAETGMTLRGADAVVVGASEIVGKPVGLLLLDRLATVTVCHVATQDLASKTSRADVIVSATGQARLVGREHVKPGAVVVDVGYSRIPDGTAPDGKAKFRVVGDVRQEEVAGIASFLTPVPGGVGPVTVSALFRNVAGAAAGTGWRPRLPADP